MTSLALAVAACVLMRLLTWPQVFTPRGVRLLPDTDPHYHVMRAERILERYPAIPWRDPLLDHPSGAAILWPPLFDELIATSARVVDGAHPTRERVERVAAFVPVAIGAATVALVADLGGLLVGGGAIPLAAWLLALLPVHIGFSALGRADQHVAELFVFCWILVAFVRCWRGGGAAAEGAGRAMPMAALALGIATAFWTWQGSALDLLALVVFAAVWHVVAPPDDPVAPRVHRALAAGGIGGAALLAISIAAWGAPGAVRSMSLNGITGLSAALSLAAGAFGALLLLARRVARPSTGRWGRLGHVLLAAAVPAALASTVVPAAREGIRHGLVALTAGNPWYPEIGEFTPLLTPGPGPIWELGTGIASEVGIMPLLVALAAPGLLARWRGRPRERPAVLLLVVLALAFLLLTLWRNRFILYFSIPMVLLAASFAHEARTRLSRHIPLLAFGALALATVVRAALHKPVMEPFLDEESIGALRWLGDDPASAEGAQGVLSRWDLGHAVLYYARKPVLVSPFGTDAGYDGMADAAAFYYARSAAEAEAITDRRRIGFLLLDNPLNFGLRGFVPGSPPISKSSYHWRGGRNLEPVEPFWELLPSRLYFADGGARPGAGGGALGGYRLLYETASAGVPEAIKERQLKIFGVVPGARLAVRCARPGEQVSGSVDVRTNQGRAFTWTTTAQADGAGAALLRLPYATGRNGAVTAGRLVVRARDPAPVAIEVPAAAVERGERLDVALSGPCPDVPPAPPAGLPSERARAAAR